jgi:hypothetical protein
MNRNENQYWPFNVLPPEQRTEKDWEVIRFLETAYRRGYKPFTFASGNFGASCGERGGMILFRTRTRWEVNLGIAEETSLSAYLDEFSHAAEGVLQWLSGVDAASVLEHVRDHLVVTPGTAPGFVLHDRQ